MQSSESSTSLSNATCSGTLVGPEFHVQERLTEGGSHPRSHLFFRQASSVVKKLSQPFAFDTTQSDIDQSRRRTRQMLGHRDFAQTSSVDAAEDVDRD